MDDWITVRQAAQVLNVRPQRIYVLIGNGTLASKKLGLTTLVSRRSVKAYEVNPNRNKFQGLPLKPGNIEPPEYTRGELEALGQKRFSLDDEIPEPGAGLRGAELVRYMWEQGGRA